MLGIRVALVQFMPVILDRSLQLFELLGKKLGCPGSLLTSCLKSNGENIVQLAYHVLCKILLGNISLDKSSELLQLLRINFIKHLLGHLYFLLNGVLSDCKLSLQLGEVQQALHR